MIAERVAEFVAEKKRRKAAPTYEQYRVVLETIFLPWCANERIIDCSEVTDKVMDRFADHLKQRPNRLTHKPLSIVTVHNYLNHTRIFLDWCDVPRGRFEMPRLPKRLFDTLTGREIDRLERVADTERDKLIVRVLADTGVRIKELLGLTKGDLSANSHERRYMINVIGKGDKEREVPIPHDTFKRLAAHSSSVGGGFVFRHQRIVKDDAGLIQEILPLRDELDRHYAGKLIHALGVKAGFDGRRVHAHLLRHTYVTDQLRAGLHPEKLRVIMGWSSLAMLRVYSHVVPADGYEEAMAGLRIRDGVSGGGDEMVRALTVLASLDKKKLAALLR